MEQLPKTFEEFLKKVVEELGLEGLSNEQQEPLFYQLQILFSNAMIEAADKVLDEEDRNYMDAHLLEHPESNELDVYFVLASEKESFKDVIKSTLDEAFDEIKFLKDSLE